MKWVGFVILAYIVLLLQTSLAAMMALPLPIGPVGPDFIAAMAVFVALRARTPADAMIACWVLGIGVDLTAGGVLGPMSLAYAVLGGMLARVRDVFRHERALTQAMLTLLFCVAAHFAWIAAQTIFLGQWQHFGTMVLQALGVALFTALLAPLLHYLLSTCSRWILRPAPGAAR